MATGEIKQSFEDEITSWSNSWTNNGQSFYSVHGREVHVHASIRNGTATSGIEIAAFGSLAPDTATLSPVFKSSGGGNGYVQIDTSGKLKLYSVSDNGSVLFDISWLVHS